MGSALGEGGGGDIVVPNEVHHIDETAEDDGEIAFILDRDVLFDQRTDEGVGKIRGTQLQLISARSMVRSVHTAS